MSKNFIVKGKTYSEIDIIDILDKILGNTLKETKLRTIDWIQTYVPKRTGQLQDDLINWLNENWIKDKSSIKISLGSNIQYYNKLIGNPKHLATWFEHSGKPAIANYYGYKGRIFLNDPKAINEWYTIIGDFITKEFKLLLEQYKNMYFG